MKADRAGQLLPLILSLWVIHPPNTQAQIIPDATLGSEASIVTPSLGRGLPSDRIDGGALRGNALFHSFLQFSIPEGRGAYFISPNADVTNIFARVTGENRSNILGRLGVIGSQQPNLTLINPNGIVFGENASLDVEGSFLATTADRVSFANGQEFSTTAPQSIPLLQIQPSALFQVGQSQPGATIVNQGNLASGKDLSLIADRLDFQGTLRAGQNLNLIAQDSLLIRDTVTTPFLALSGANTTLQATNQLDILALNHPHLDSFQSGGDLSLLSNQPVSGDAHFRVGGNFAVRTLNGNRGSLVSRFDPIIEVRGDYTIGDYLGASLQVTAGGNINYLKATISQIDPAINPIQPVFRLIAGGSIIGEDRISTTLPAGKLIVELRGQGQIQTGEIITNGGDVTIVSGQQNIKTQKIDTQSITDNAGSIFLSAAGKIETQEVTSRSSAINGNGGNITLKSGNGGIQAGEIASTASFNPPPGQTGQAGNGGNIDIQIGQGNFNAIFVESYASSNVTSVGKGGSINITVDRGDIQLSQFVKSATNAALNGIGFRTGDAGDIKLVAADGSIRMGTVESYTYSAYDPTIGDLGINSGNITIAAPKGSVAITERILSFSSNGAGGTISIQAKDDLVLPKINSTGRQNSGGITIESQGQISSVGKVLAADTFGGGVGGNVQITGKSIGLDGGTQISASTHDRGQGGNIRLTATESIQLTGKTLNQPNLDDLFAASGVTQQGGFGVYLPTLNPQDKNFNQAASFPSGLFTQTTVGSTGNAGNITIATPQLILQDQAAIGTTTFGAGQAGNITIVQLQSNVLISGSSIFSGVASPDSGNSGRIEIQARSIKLDNQGLIQTQTLGKGDGGSVILTAQDISLVNRSKIASGSGDLDNQTRTIGRAGNIEINAGNFNLSSGAALDAETFTTAKGGDILINANKVILDQGQFRTAAQNLGQAGNTKVKANNLRLRNNSKIVTTSELSNAGDITLDSTTIVALEGSDILAFAPVGQGGGIIFNTRAFLSNPLYRPTAPTTDRGTLNALLTNDRVDVNASGAVSGTIAGVPDITFLQNGLTQLPNNQIDTNKLVAQTCLIRRDQPEGTFYIIGKGSIPNRPHDPALSSYPTNTIQPTTQIANRPWKLGDQIVEPQGFYRLADGNLVMSRECDSP